MKKRIIIIAVGLLLVAGFFVVRGFRKEPDFSLEEVKKGEMEVLTSASGEVKAEKDATLRFQTSGLLSWVGVQKGGTVKRGQAVASLDKRDLEKRLQKEMNSYLNERWDFEQTQDDYEETKEKSLVTDEIKRILEKTQFDLNSSVLDVEIADLTVRLSTLVSPFEGIVTDLDQPYSGVNVGPTTASFRIVDPKSIYFEAKIDETDVPRVKIGDKVKLYIDAYPEETFFGTVGKVDFGSTTSSGGGTAYNTWIYFNSADPDFRLGMNGDAEIIHSSLTGILLVPISAFTEKGGKTYVWKVVDGKALQTEIEIGNVGDDYVEVVSGLNEGDRIITSNLNLLKEGMKIKTQ
jgi:RND family efflux transporter MFP subunit